MSAETNQNARRATADGVPDSDQLLSVITDVEKQLVLLRTLKEEREANRQRLTEMQAEMSEREQRLQDRQRAIQEAETKLRASGEQIAHAQQEHNARVERFEAEARQRTEGFEREAAARAETIERQAKELQVRAADFDQQRRSLEERSSELERVSNRLTQDRAELEALAEDLRRREVEVGQAREEFESMKRRAAELQGELDRATRVAGERATEAARHGEHAESLAAQVQELRASLEGRTTELQLQQAEALRLGSVIADLRREADERSREVSDLRRAESTLAAQLKEQQALATGRGEQVERLAAQERTLSQELSQSRRLADEASRALQEQQAKSQELAQLRARLEQELVEKARLLEHAQLAAEESRVAAQAVSAGAASSDATISDLRRQIVERDARIQFLSQRITTILAERDQQVEELRRAASGAISDPAFREQIEEHERRVAELESAVSARDQRIEELAATLQSAGAGTPDLKAARVRIADLEGALATREARIQDLAQALAARTGEVSELNALPDRLRELERMLASRDEQIERLKSARDAASARSAELAGLQGRIEELSQAVESRDRQIAELSRAVESRASTDKSEVASLRRDLLERQASEREQQSRLLQLQAKLDEAVSGRELELSALRAHIETLTSGNASSEEFRQQLVEAQGQAQQLAERLDSAREDNRELRRKLKERQSNAEGQIPEHIGDAIATRRRRLNLVRDLLSEQSAKLGKANDAVRQRFEQCEQIIAQRENLVAARAALSDGKRKVDRLAFKYASVKTLTGLFYALAIAIILGGVSWLISGTVYEPIYAARASIEQAADDGKYANPEMIAEWQNRVIGLKTDDAFLDDAADRLFRAGYATLGQPGALKARLNTDLKLEATQPGHIVIDFKGAGDKTKRIFETLTSAIIAQINRTKDHNPDGLGAVLKDEPKLEGVVEDQRPIYAAGIFLIGFGLTSLIGIALVRRLVAAKARFDEETQVDTALDAAAWRSLASAGASGASAPASRAS